MKVLVFTVVDVLFAIMFWMGLSICCLFLGFLTNPRRVIDIMTKREDPVSRVDGCRGNIVLPLMALQYRIYIQFPDSRFHEGDHAYFDGTLHQRRTCYFWETLGATISVTIRDERGNVVPLKVDSDAYAQFIIGPTNSGQSIGLLNNQVLNMDTITIQYSIDKNCDKLLLYEPSIRVRASAQKEIVLVRFGMILLTTSSVWIIMKRLAARRRRRKAGGTSFREISGQALDS